VVVARWPIWKWPRRMQWPHGRSAGPRIAPGKRSQPRDSPTRRSGPRGVGLHDEGDAVPEAAAVRAADLVGAAEMIFHEAPVRVKLLEDGASTRCVKEGA
jgi:hypothetical protein